MRKKIFTFLLALAASVGMSWADEVTIVFAANNNTKEVTVELPHTFWCSFDDEDGELDLIIQELYGLSMSGFCGDYAPTATGNAAVTAGTKGEDHYITISDVFAGTATVEGSYFGYYQPLEGGAPEAHEKEYSLTISIKNYTPEPAPTYTVALEDGTVNADKVTLSATSAEEGATITVTPDEEYEITAFSAYYVVVEDQLGSIYEIDATLDPGTGAYSFTMPAANVTIEATIAEKAAPTPQPVTDPITPYADPQDASVYYSTFYDSNFKYELPAGVEAYVADLSGANLLLTKIAEAGEVIPANVAVILKATVTPFTLTPSDAEAVTFTATNDLQGSDTQIATPANCYVLAGTDGVVGFYHYTAANLNAHKAYVVYSGSNQAPRRMPFIFDQATGVENVQNSDIRSQKVVENGQLIIIRNGVRYNAAGQNVK